jgi:predicted HD phosphohydrolase
MTNSERATFNRMTEATPEDMAIFYRVKDLSRAEFPSHLMSMLALLAKKSDGSPIDGYAHSLQSASLAYEDGADDETVFIALFHDIGQLVAEENHSEVSAAILKPYISEQGHWVVKHHAAFQMHYYGEAAGKDAHAREVFSEHPHYQACIDFCEKYDQCAFDREYKSKPAEFFLPLVERVIEARASSSMTTGRA